MLEMIMFYTVQITMAGALDITRWQTEDRFLDWFYGKYENAPKGLSVTEAVNYDQKSAVATSNILEAYCWAETRKRDLNRPSHVLSIFAKKVGKDLCAYAQQDGGFVEGESVDFDPIWTSKDGSIVWDKFNERVTWSNKTEEARSLGEAYLTARADQTLTVEITDA